MLNTTDPTVELFVKIFKLPPETAATSSFPSKLKSAIRILVVEVVTLTAAAKEITPDVDVFLKILKPKVLPVTMSNLPSESISAIATVLTVPETV